MSILTENSKKMLVESMRECLSDVLHESTSLTSKQATDKIKYVNESATYEQLLNITMNPHREEKYLPSYVLEGAVAILHSACMTGRKIIGPNAITEGALKLQKKTGAVITESMMDAALAAATEGCGLKVVGKILTEATYSEHIRGLSGLSADSYNALKLARTDGGAALSARSSAIQSELTALAQRLGYKEPAVVGQTWANDLIAAGRSGDVKKLSAFRRQLINAGRDTIKRNAISTLDSTAPSSLSPRQLRKLEARVNGVNPGSAGSNALKKAANSNVGKTPWGKIALGAAAVGGAGALGWKYWQNRKAMQRDIANGTSPY